MKIPEEFVPLHVRYRRDRAIRRVGNDGELMYLRALAHAKAEKTGGLIEDFDLDDIGAGIVDRQDTAARLVEERLWEKVESGWMIRSFEKWNPAAVDWAAEGRRGNHEKWHVQRGVVQVSCEFCNPPVDNFRVSGETPSHSPVIGGDIGGESGGESQEKSKSKSKSKSREEKRETSSSQLRSDVAAILDHLDQRIQANGAKKPTRTKANTDAARLLLDRDHRPADEVHRIIDWCTRDNFWKSNILSAKKLREHYDRLLMQAQRPANAPRSASQPSRNTRIIRTFLDAQRGAQPPSDPNNIIEGELA